MDCNNEKTLNELKTDIWAFYREFGPEETINSFEEEILSLNNARLSLFFSNIKGADIKRHGQTILDSGDIELISKFVQDHFDKAQEQIDYITNSGNASYIFKLIETLYDKNYNFAYDHITDLYDSSKISAEYKNQLEKCVDGLIKSNDSEYCYKFIKFVIAHINDKINVRDYNFNGRMITKPKYVGILILNGLKSKVLDAESVIIQGGNNEYNYLCASTMIDLSCGFADYASNATRGETFIKAEDIDYAGHSKAIIESGDAEYNYLFAKKYGSADGVNIKTHGEVVMRSNDLDYNYLFAQIIEGADVLKHGKVIIDSKNAKYNYLFAKDIEGADIEAHSKAVIKSKNPKYNYLFVRNFEGADIEAHSKVVLESKNPEYNYLFCMLERGDFDDYEHRIAVLESKDLYYNLLLAKQFPEHELYQHHCDVIVCSGNEEYISKIVDLKPNRVNAIKEKIRTLHA